MTTSQLRGIAIVLGAVGFLFAAFFGVLPALFAMAFIALRMTFSIVMLCFVAWITNAGKPKEKGQ